MSYTPENSSIRTSAEIEKAISEAPSQAAVQQILRQAAIDQKIVTPDAYDPNVLLEVEPGSQPRAYAKRITVNGVTHLIEGSSETDLLAKENAFFKEQFTATTQQHEQPRDAADAAKAAQDELFRRSELELKFKRGELSAADYLEQSGAVAEYLEKAGVPLEDLQASVEEKQNTRMRQSWEEATEAFLNSPEGQDWPGGEENLTRIGNLLQKMDATEEPSVENLAIAYKWLRDNNQIVPNPETETQSKIASAKTPQEIREALGRGSSSLFGGR
jgi:hypothetical protein